MKSLPNRLIISLVNGVNIFHMLTCLQEHKEVGGAKWRHCTPVKLAYHEVSVIRFAFRRAVNALKNVLPGLFMV